MENPELSLPQLPATPAPAAFATAPPVLGGPHREDPFSAPRPEGLVARTRRRVGSILAAIVAAVAKFFTAIKGAILLLPKIKLLTTAGTALVSVAAYSLFWGWWFAVGFVVLLFLHEMGHVIQLRREGIKASAPMFMPFMGALITARPLGDDALAEARVGLAGPVLGTIASGAAWRSARRRTATSSARSPTSASS